MNFGYYFDAAYFPAGDLGYQSFIQLMGSDGSSVGTEMTAYAESLGVEVIGSEMNKARDAFYGSLPVGMCLDDQGFWRDITMQQLVNGASFSHNASKSFKVTEHIRDNDEMIEFHKTVTASGAT